MERGDSEIFNTPFSHFKDAQTKNSGNPTGQESGGGGAITTHSVDQASNASGAGSTEIVSRTQPGGSLVVPAKTEGRVVDVQFEELPLDQETQLQSLREILDTHKGSLPPIFEKALDAFLRKVDSGQRITTADLLEVKKNMVSHRLVNSDAKQIAQKVEQLFRDLEKTYDFLDYESQTSRETSPNPSRDQAQNDARPSGFWSVVRDWWTGSGSGNMGASAIPIPVPVNAPQGTPDNPTGSDNAATAPENVDEGILEDGARMEFKSPFAFNSRLKIDGSETLKPGGNGITTTPEAKKAGDAVSGAPKVVGESTDQDPDQPARETTPQLPKGDAPAPKTKEANGEAGPSGVVENTGAPNRLSEDIRSASESILADMENSYSNERLPQMLKDALQIFLGKVDSGTATAQDLAELKKQAQGASYAPEQLGTNAIKVEKQINALEKTGYFDGTLAVIETPNSNQIDSGQTNNQSGETGAIETKPMPATPRPRFDLNKIKAQIENVKKNGTTDLRGQPILFESDRPDVRRASNVPLEQALLADADMLIEMGVSPHLLELDDYREGLPLPKNDSGASAGPRPTEETPFGKIGFVNQQLDKAGIGLDDTVVRHLATKANEIEELIQRSRRPGVVGRIREWRGDRNRIIRQNNLASTITSYMRDWFYDQEKNDKWATEKIKFEQFMKKITSGKIS